MMNMVEVVDNKIDLGEMLGVREENPEKSEVAKILRIWFDRDSVHLYPDKVVIYFGIERDRDELDVEDGYEPVWLKLTLTEGSKHDLKLVTSGGDDYCFKTIQVNGTDMTGVVLNCVKYRFCEWLEWYKYRFTEIGDVKR